MSTSRSRPGTGRRAFAAWFADSEDADLAARARFPVRVELARDPARIIAWLGVRLVIAEISLVVGLQTPGAIGVAVVVAGIAVLAYVALLTLHVLSLRLEVSPEDVRVASILVRRRYPLHEGAVTRLRVEPRKGIFGTQLGGFGIEIGLGRSPSKEAVDVVRLAPVSTLIVIPTAPTRLAVVPSSERTLVRALELAAGSLPLRTPQRGGQGAASRASR